MSCCFCWCRRRRRHYLFCLRCLFVVAVLWTFILSIFKTRIRLYMRRRLRCGYFRFAFPFSPSPRPIFISVNLLITNTISHMKREAVQPNDMHISIDSQLKAQTKSVWFPSPWVHDAGTNVLVGCTYKINKATNHVQHAGIYLHLMAERSFVRDKSKNYYFNWTLILCLCVFFRFFLIHWEWQPASVNACGKWKEREWNLREKKSHFRREIQHHCVIYESRHRAAGESGSVGAKVEMKRWREKKVDA